MDFQHFIELEVIQLPILTLKINIKLTEVFSCNNHDFFPKRGCEWKSYFTEFPRHNIGNLTVRFRKLNFSGGGGPF